MSFRRGGTVCVVCGVRQPAGVQQTEDLYNLHDVVISLQQQLIAVFTCKHKHIHHVYSSLL